MNNFINFFQNFIEILASKQLFLFTETVACLVILTIGFLVTKRYLEQKNITQKYNHAFYFLLLIIISMAIENLAWIFKLSNQLEYTFINVKYIQVLAIVAWIFNNALYQSLGLFIENIIENKITIRWHHKLFFLCNSFFILLFIYTGFYHIMEIPAYISLHTIFRIAIFYRPFLVIPSIIIAFNNMYNKNIPSIINKQLTIFLKFILFPFLLSDLIQCLPIFNYNGVNADISGLVATICVTFMTCAIIFCSVNLIRFRFFNFFNKVQDKNKTGLTGNFKDTIEYLSLATTPQELIYISQTFFKENFQISIENSCLSFRYKQETCSSDTDNYCQITNNVIESFINKEDQSIEFLRKYRILVADEIEFDAYYNTNEHELKLAEFLQNIKSEIFLPMYDKNNIIAYLTVKRSNQPKFYSLAEQNKIIIFGTFLASAINIMHNRNTTTLLHENKKVKEELYLKHQEVNQYKESIKHILKQKTNSQVGILFYKDDRFTFGNEAAHNLLPMNLNQQRKDATTMIITKLAQQVESFRTLQSRMIYDHKKQLMITGVPHFDYQSGVILTVHYPDTSDVIKAQIDTLQDPSRIDYLLYLETTKSGKLINQIIPSNSELLLTFKIKLLEIALHKKAILLESHCDDLLTIVEIIHHISLKSNLHILDLKPTATTHDLAIKLFGLNPLLMSNQEDGLLKKLDQNGTLFIKNVELLDLDTQNKLAEFIRYGMYTILKSEQKIAADVRIICSVSQNPQMLIEQNKLSITLFHELAETTLKMPSLIMMDDKELQELIDGFAHQAMQMNKFSNLLQISKKDKQELIDRKPASLQEFKLKIELLLSQKSKEYHIFHETHCDPEFDVTNPKLLKAANLGKHALKDPQTMSLLWTQFNCQSKIAQFLGVNRSSVQRRCKEYNLL